MEFLTKYGINEVTIKEINDNYYPEIIDLFIINEKEVERIIEYLRELGIINIEKLIVYNIKMFLNTKEELETLLSRFNIEDVVNLINNDFTNLDLFIV